MDWSPAGKPEWGGKKVKLWCFSMVLGYSRAMYIEFTHRSGGYLYYFSELDCSVCPLKEGYLKNTQTRKRIYLRPEVFTYRLCSIKRAMRIRKTIERVFGEVKTWHCLYRARYRGLARVTVQVLLTFLVVNAKKMATGLAARGSVCACQP
ncbi:MAG: transposase [Thermanaeromonas sp.]|uniref:transposase n=1 Tax=Thermanaeromonas sp. TaxID=2003697 RepID=UPI00243CCBFE|nr:transposase [Thermanaeromonas sp.]MCG0278411.1 transposase [Thermanaeromonas sp.]